MARLFDDAIPHDIQIASALLSGVPISMAGWFRSDDAGAAQTICSISDNTAGDVNYFTLLAQGLAGGDPVRARTRSSGDLGTAITTTGYSVNTWHHACGVFAAVDDRRAFIDGGSKGTDATSVTPAGLDVTTIGSRRQQSGTAEPMSGRIAEVAIWNAALTDAEVAILAAGYSPLLVRSQNLVLYTPLVREILDVVGGVALTNNGSTVGDHPRVLLPPPPVLVPPLPAAFVPRIASQRLKIGVGR